MAGDGGDADAYFEPTAPAVLLQPQTLWARIPANVRARAEGRRLGARRPPLLGAAHGGAAAGGQAAAVAGAAETAEVSLACGLVGPAG